MLELCGSENGVQILGLDTHLRLLALCNAIGDAHRCVAHHAPDLTFELPYSGLTRVIRNNAVQGLDRYFILLFAQTICLALTCNKITQPDLEFFLPGITREID